MKNTVFFLLIVISSKSLAAEIIIEPQLVTVGADESCHFNSIQSAINSVSSGSEIRVSNDKTYFENITITDKNIILNGGFISCQNAYNNIYNDEISAIIDGLNISSVMRINGYTSLIELTNVALINGNEIAGGGLNISTNDFGIILHNVSIINNQALVGGGIHISGNNNYMELTGQSSVSHNRANNAGGIYCLDTYLKIKDKTGITFNYADGEHLNNGFGGGIYASTQCIINLSTGIGEESSSHTVGISTNKANNSGGGMYLDGSEDRFISTKLIAYEVTNRPINIDNNIANFNEDGLGDGGGIYLKNANMISSNIYLDNNHVLGQGHGGGIYSIDSRVALFGNDNCPAFDKYYCNRISRNTAKNGNGGAIYAHNDFATLHHDYINNMYITDNRARDGSFMYSSFNDMEIVSSFIVNNGSSIKDGIEDNSVIYATDQSQVRLVHVTLAANEIDTIIENKASSQVNIENSILVDEITSNVLIDDLTSITTIKCSLTHDLEDLQNNTNAILSNVAEQSAIQLFVDATSNYHIKGESLAVDRCIDNSITAVTHDRDYQNFGHNIPGVGNFPEHSRVYDAGADEYVDTIFKNGMEKVQ